MWGMWKRATVVSVVLTLLGSAPVAEAAFPGQNGKIAFDAGGQVRTVNADGSGSAVVGSGADPAWSPDGTRLLFYDGVYFRVTTADGSTVRTILTGFGRDPIWSPDGTRIAFVRDRPWDDQSYPDEIVVMNADGSGETQITAGGCPGDPFNFPPCDEIQSLSWEPNGNRIAFTRAEWYRRPELRDLRTSIFAILRASGSPIRTHRAQRRSCPHLLMPRASTGSRPGSACCSPARACASCCRTGRGSSR